MLSPRLGDCVFVLMSMHTGAPTLLSTAFVVASQSGSCLLTASHGLIPVAQNLGSLFLVSSITNNDDGTTTMEPCPPISVEVVEADPVSDIAVLRARTPFERSISLCPPDEFPSARREDIVKSYHCPIAMYTNGEVDTAAVMATSYDKLKMESRHHLYVTSEHMKGSSGGVLVDIHGRAVGLICSGYVPGVRLPIPDSFQTLWETVTALSDGSGAFTKAVKFSCVPSLYSFLANN